MSESALNDPVLRDPKLQAELKAQCQAGKPSIVWVDGLYVDLTRWALSRLPLIDGMRDHSLPPTGKGTLITVHKLGTPDRLYDLQLRKAMEVANARTLRELGPLPSGGLSSQEKHNAGLAPRLNPDQVEQLRREHQAACEEYDRWMERKRVAASNGEENDEMKLGKMIAISALATGMGGTACGVDTRSPEGRLATMNEREVVAATSIDAGSVSASRWGPQPEFRSSFDSCWSMAKTDEDKLGCIREELVYQSDALSVSYQRLQGELSRPEWELVRDEQSRWLRETETVCAMTAGLSNVAAVDSTYCRLYRTEARRYELQTMIELEREDG